MDTVNVTDMFGQTLKEGDRVVHVYKESTSVTANLGIVEAVKEEEYWTGRKIGYVKVKKVNTNHFWTRNKKEWIRSTGSRWVMAKNVIRLGDASTYVPRLDV